MVDVLFVPSLQGQAGPDFRESPTREFKRGDREIIERVKKTCESQKKRQRIIDRASQEMEDDDDRSTREIIKASGQCDSSSADDIVGRVSYNLETNFVNQLAPAKINEIIRWRHHDHWATDKIPNIHNVLNSAGAREMQLFLVPWLISDCGPNFRFATARGPAAQMVKTVLIGGDYFKCSIGPLVIPMIREAPRAFAEEVKNLTSN